ncbi:MAG: hypothetical protein ABI853_01255 [Sphingomicrobium sp.]
MTSDWIIRKQPIVAVALLTAEDLKALGPSFDRAWPVDHAPCFEELIEASDQADRAIEAGADGNA